MKEFMLEEKKANTGNKHLDKQHWRNIDILNSCACIAVLVYHVINGLK